MAEVAFPPEGMAYRDARRIALAARTSSLWHRSLVGSLPAGGAALVFLVGSLWLAGTRIMAVAMGLPCLALAGFCLARSWQAGNRVLDLILPAGPPPVHALRDGVREAEAAGDRRAARSAGKRLVALAREIADASVAWDDAP